MPEGAVDAPPAQPMSRVLLAAAHKDLIRNLTGAVRAAGLSVASVDLVPLALVRSVGRRVSDNGGGVEAIACEWDETSKAIESLLTRARQAFRVSYEKRSGNDVAFKEKKP